MAANAKISMPFDLNEKRYLRETGLEQRIAHSVEPVANDLGYALVRVKVTQENGCTLQIMAEDAAGRFTITDCERLSKDLSPVLDVEDPIDREYHLEVSSPGIDRPLVRPEHFARFAGFEARIELNRPLDGRKRFQGRLLGLEGEAVRLGLGETTVDLPLSAIARAKLVLTDELIAATQPHHHH